MEDEGRWTSVFSTVNMALEASKEIWKSTHENNTVQKVTSCARSQGVQTEKESWDERKETSHWLQH